MDEDALHEKLELVNLFVIQKNFKSTSECLAKEKANLLSSGNGSRNLKLAGRSKNGGENGIRTRGGTVSSSPV